MDTASRREEARAAFLDRDDFFLECDIGFFEPLGELVERENGVDDTFVVGGFVFFGDTRPDEDGFGIGHAPFNVFAVGLHWAEYVGEVWELGGEILLNEQIDGVATRRDEDIARTIGE